MKVKIGRQGLTMTWQEDFPDETKCCHCKGVSRIGFVAFEGQQQEEYVCNLHPNKGKGDYWLHDAVAVAVYFCKECLEPTALYNQA